MSSIEDLKDKLQDAMEVFLVGCQRELDAKDKEITDLETDLDTPCAECEANDKEVECLEKALLAVCWGNCLRGCPPAYIVDGFCSPGCRDGGARGQFYSVPEEKNVILPISQAS